RACTFTKHSNEVDESFKVEEAETTNKLYQLTSMAFCLLVGWCSDKLGLSLELGSFAAGRDDINNRSWSTYTRTSNTSPSSGGYDYMIGTSEHGQIIKSHELEIPSF
ncbi:hypothetical protein S83_067306, partial [Arachis hypogaea]